jgi:tRNA(Ile)-lysidine synthase TilS/MesJ
MYAENHTKGDRMKKLLSKTRAAIDRYGMLGQNEKIAVGVSGGKDSLVLLRLMAALREFHPAHFGLAALCLDPCFGGKAADYSGVESLCSELDVPLIIKRSRLGEIIFEERGEKNPCSLCARMRRGILHNMALEAGCTRLALGHHMDDAAATFWLNLTSGSRIGCFSPVTYLDRKGITLIRPMIFCREREISAAAVRLGLPVMKSACPADGCTQRAAAQNILIQLEKNYPDLTGKIIAAMQSGNISGW